MNTSKSLRIARAERIIKNAEAEIAKILSRPEEPEADADGAVVLWFKRRFGETRGSSIYTYAAVKVGGYWYLSGPQLSGRRFTWDDLLDWLGDDLVGTMWVSESWTEVM